MSFRHWCIYFYIIYSRISTSHCKNKSDLTFVIDSTKSMQYEIDQVTDAIDYILDVMDTSQATEIKDILLVAFNDPEVTLLLKSRSRFDIKAKLKSIKADGGLDCPELSLSGTKLGLEGSSLGSYMYVFTDDNPKDPELERNVIQLCQEKQIQVVFMITPSSVLFCQRQLKKFGPYYNIARACSGQVFRLSNKNEISKVIVSTKVTGEGPKTLITAKELPPNVWSPVEFAIDDQTEYAVLSTSGDNVILEIESGPSKEYEIIVWLNNVKMVKIETPGNYVAKVLGQSATSVIVFGRTDFTFQHGFSDNIPSFFDGDEKQSTQETKSHLLILVDDPHSSVEIDSLQILNMDEQIVLEQPLRRESGNYYSTEKIIPPNNTFKIAVTGKVVNSKRKIRRIGKISIEPKIKPRSPSIVINNDSTSITIPYKSTLSLSCYVTAYPKPEIVWRDESIKIVTSSETSENGNVTSYVNYLTIPNFKKAQRFFCEAQNEAGKANRTIHVDVPSPLINTQPPYVKCDARYGEQQTVYCNVISSYPIRIKWFLSKSGKDKSIKSSNDYTISSDGKILNIKEVYPNLEGKYKCVAALVEDKAQEKTLTTELKINNLAVPVIDKKEIFVSVKETTEVNLACNIISGIPKPSTTWKFKSRVLGSRAVIRITNVTSENSGKYTCSAENSEGRDVHTIELDVKVTPEIDKSITIIKVKEHDSVAVECNILKGNPVPKITWHVQGRDEGSEPKLLITNVKSGDYKCVAENIAGRDEHIFKLDVQARPVLDKSETVIKAKINDVVGMNCNILKGNPKPKIRWMFQNNVVGSDTTLNISTVTLAKAGNYSCIAENTEGVDVYTVKLDVEEPHLSKVVINNDFTSIKIPYKSTLSLSCYVTGYPKPVIVWRDGSSGIVTTSETSENGNATRFVNHLTIPNLMKTQRFSCGAENEAGKRSRTITVNVQSPLMSTQRPNGKVDARYGEQQIVYCNVSSNFPIRIEWFLGKTRKYKVIRSSNDYAISPDSKILNIKEVYPNLEGKYKCVATLVEDKAQEKTLTTEVKINNLAAPLIDKKEKYVSVQEKTEVNLTCNIVSGTPKPKITWKLKDLVMGSNAVLRITDVTLDNSGNYTCSAENSEGRDEHTIELDVKVAPAIKKDTIIVKARENTPVTIHCVTLKGNPLPTITWKYKDRKRGSGAQLHIAKVTPAQSGDYKCIAENEFGRDEHIFKLDVEASPTIDKTNTIENIKENQTLKLNCNLKKGNPEPDFTWVFNNQVISSNEELDIEKVTNENSGDYKCIANNTIGRDEHTIKVVVQVGPVINKDIIIVKARENTAVTIHCVMLKSNPKPTITWEYKNRVQESGEQLLIANVTSEQSGDYKCIAENKFGRDEHVFNLDVEASPAIDKSKIIEKVRENQTLRIHCNLKKGNPKPDITWKFKNQLISSSKELIIKKVTNENSGDYKCIANNTIGQDEHTIKVVVQVLPKIDKKEKNVQVQEYKPVELKCKIQKGNPTPTVSWVFDGKIIGSGPTLYKDNVNLTDAGDYKCIATNTVGHDEHQVRLIVKGAPIVTINNGEGANGVVGDRVLRIPCEAVGYPKPTITWMINGKVIDKEDENFALEGNILVIKNLKQESKYKYFCKAVNPMGQDEKNITVEITNFIENYNSKRKYVLRDTKDRLDCSLNFSDTDLVRWFKNGVFDSEGPYRFIERASIMDDGNYTCRVSYSTGSMNSEPIEVYVDEPPKSSLIKSPKIINWIGKKHKTDCYMELYNDEYEVTWLHNGKEMKNQHSKELTFSDWGNYTCRVKNHFGQKENRFIVMSTDCLFDMETVNQPLLLTKTLEITSFKMNSRYLIIPSGTHLKLGCDKFKKDYIAIQNEVICLKEDQYLLDDKTDKQKTMHVSDLYCDTELKPQKQRTGKQCLGENTEFVKLGFSVKKFVEVFETCFDTSLKVPLYTRINKPNPKYLMFEDNDLAYKGRYGKLEENEVKKTFDSTIPKCTYTTGHLINVEDINFGIAQTAAVSMPEYNDIYQLSCNGELVWEQLEETIRESIAANRDDPGHIIWSGASKWEIDNEVMVPRYLWKVVKIMGTEDTFSMIYDNGHNPSASDKLCGKAENYVDCWFEVPQSVYCCEIAEFADAFKIPVTVFT